MNLRQEQARAQAFVRHLIAVGTGDLFDDAVQAQPPQVIGYPRGYNARGVLPSTGPRKGLGKY